LTFHIAGLLTNKYYLALLIIYECFPPYCLACQ